MNVGLLVLLLWPEAERESEPASLAVPAGEPAPIERDSTPVEPRPADNTPFTQPPQATDSSPPVGRAIPEPVTSESPALPAAAESDQLAVAIATPAQSPVVQQRQVSDKAPAAEDAHRSMAKQSSLLPKAEQPLPQPAVVQPPPQPVAELARPALPVWPQIPSHLFQQLNGSLRLDVHVFSDQPRERFVLINMKKYKQGEKLQEGPQLDEITAEGVILSFRGQQFRLQAQ